MVNGHAFFSSSTGDDASSKQQQQQQQDITKKSSSSSLEQQQQQQHVADVKILRTLAKYLWLKDNLEFRFRVVTALGFLIGAKVPFFIINS